MELMTKYQYTYFVYPYIIEQNKYKKYLQRLLRNKKCKIRFFDKQKDIHLYTYFLPSIRQNMFWSFGLNKRAIRDFERMDTSVQSTLLSQYECNIFNYELPENLQGKVETNNGIFFEISEIKIICYKTGICFLLFKTNLENSDSFSDILNFNYKFREVNSISYDLKEYENIKIQSNLFKNVKDISVLIKEITGNNSITKKANIGNEKFFVYTYTCVDQKNWNENTENEALDNLEWCDRIYNMNYGSCPTRISQNNSKPIFQVNLDGSIVKRYPSVIQASKETGIPSSTIYDCTRGARKKAWGYIWKYAN